MQTLERDEALETTARRARRGRATRLWSFACRHVLALVSGVALATWLLRWSIFSSSLPAGTDMLGYISRAEQNSTFTKLTSLWSTQSFGSRRTITLESVLGVLTMATRNPIVSVKIFIFALIVTAFLSTYALTIHWTRRRSIALLAATLYVLSQASLSHWGSGQVNVEVLVATAPLFMLLWDRCLDNRSAVRVVGLTLLASALVLARLDLLLYIIPVLVLQTIFRLFVTNDRRATGRSVSFAVVVGAPAFVLVNAYLFVPVLRGVRASWVTTTALFSTTQSLGKSLAAYPTLLGFGREIGYFAFSNQETWYSNRYFSFDLYVAFASGVLVLAYGALLLKRRDRPLIFLALLALLATFAAKGGRPPFGGAYSFASSHVGLLASLRDPNRWLIFQAVGYAILAATTVTFIRDRARASLSGWPRRLAPGAIVLVVMAVVLAPVSPTLVLGLQTWRPPSDAVALLRRIGKDPTSFAVATIPYRQSFQPVQDHNYKGFEHDLGTESTLYTGHSSVGTGDWSQRGSDFVAYTSQLLRSGDPAFARLLGSAGVKYLVSFDRPVDAPHLVDQQLGGLYQQRSAATMSGLTPVMTNKGGTVYSVDGWAPTVTVRPNTALILGGREGLAAFADMRGVHLKDWAAVTADDAISTGGLPLLLELIMRSRAVIAGTDSVDEVGVLATRALATGNGFTSDPGLATQTINIASDQSALSGSMADQNQAPAKIGVSSSSVALTTHAGQPLEFWSRVRFSPAAAQLSLRIDGKLVRSLTPVSAAGPYFQTVRLFSGTLSRGTHRFVLSAAPSDFGSDYEVDQSKVVDQVERARVGKELTSALAEKTSDTWYSLDPTSAIKWSSSGGFVTPAVSYAAPLDFWVGTDPAHVHLSARSDAVDIAAASGRKYFTLVKHVFGSPIDWSRRTYMFLRLRGSDSGQTISLFVSSNGSTAPSARVQYDLVDNSDRWRTVALPIGDGSGLGDSTLWGAVGSVSLATSDRQAAVDLEISGLSISHELVALHAAIPVVAGSRRAVSVSTWNGATCGSQLVGPAQSVAARASVVRLSITSAFLHSACRTGLEPDQELSGAASVAVAARSESPTHHAFVGGTASGDAVVLTQSYDAGWRLKQAGTSVQPIVVGSVLAGFEVQKSALSGDIEFIPQRVQPLGMWISVVSLFGLVLGAVVWDRRRLRSTRSSRTRVGRRRRRRAVTNSKMHVTRSRRSRGARSSD